MKLKRFMCEYASYIEKEYFGGFNVDIELMLRQYQRGVITLREVMRTLNEIDYAQHDEKTERM